MVASWSLWRTSHDINSVAEYLGIQEGKIRHWNKLEMCGKHQRSRNRPLGFISTGATNSIQWVLTGCLLQARQSWSESETKSFVASHAQKDQARKGSTWIKRKKRLWGPRLTSFSIIRLHPTGKWYLCKWIPQLQVKEGPNLPFHTCPTSSSAHLILHCYLAPKKFQKVKSIVSHSPNDPLISNHRASLFLLLCTEP